MCSNRKVKTSADLSADQVGSGGEAAAHDREQKRLGTAVLNASHERCFGHVQLVNLSDGWMDFYFLDCKFALAL